MAGETKRTLQVETGLTGIIWFIGFLFTLGFVKLAWWQMLLAIVVWPYFLGVAVR